jgi:hypothetical protein
MMLFANWSRKSLSSGLRSGSCKRRRRSLGRTGVGLRHLRVGLVALAVLVVAPGNRWLSVGLGLGLGQALSGKLPGVSVVRRWAARSTSIAIIRRASMAISEGRGIVPLLRHNIGRHRRVLASGVLAAANLSRDDRVGRVARHHGAVLGMNGLVRNVVRFHRRSGFLLVVC